MPESCDAVALIHRFPLELRPPGAERPLFVCAEMFLGLDDIERKRWRLWKLRNDLAAAGAPVAVLSDFLLPEDVAWLEEGSVRVSHGWYLAGGRDWSEYRGVSLGRCCEYDMKAKAMRLLKFALTCSRLLERCPGRPVFTDYRPGSDQWQMLEALGASPRPLQTVAEEATLPPAGVRQSLKGALESRARLLGLSLCRALGWLRRCAGTRRGPVAVVRLNLQSLQMLEAWRREPAPEVRIAMWTSVLIRPRAVLSLIGAGAFFAAPPAGALERPDELAAVLARAAAAGERPALPALPGWGSLQPAFDRLFDQALRHDFPKAAAAVDHARRVLQDPAATLLVLPNDCQQLMRAWTLAARALGKKTLVLQHGHLDYTEDEDHHAADYSAFWSDQVADDFLRAGLKPWQVRVSGSPNADLYHAVPVPPRPAGAPLRVLVMTTGNPGVQAYLDEAWVADYIWGVLADLFGSGDPFEVTVKLHPGESAELYLKHARPWIDRAVAVVEKGNLAQLLSACDVVVSPPSTVVLEARALGVPVVLVAIDPVDGRASNLSEAEGVLTVRRGESVAGAVRRLVGEPAPPCGTLPLERFLGPLDGGNSRRLLGVLHELALDGEPVAAVAASRDGGALDAGSR